MTANKDQLLGILSSHVGRGKGISAVSLAEGMDTYSRNVRSLITELRLDGIAICGTPETGYYIAETAEELEDTCQFLRQRALHSLHLEACLRKVPLADLVGQMHLKT